MYDIKLHVWGCVTCDPFNSQPPKFHQIFGALAGKKNFTRILKEKNGEQNATALWLMLTSSAAMH